MFGKCRRKTSAQQLQTTMHSLAFVRKARQRSEQSHGDHVDCVKVLIPDDDDPTIVYSGSWDRCAKAWDTNRGTCLRTYYGPQHDIIDLAQTSTRSGLGLLFAVGGQPGVCCWRKGSAQLIAVFNTEPDLANDFIAYSVAATPAMLIAGHAIDGILSWRLDDDTLAAVKPTDEPLLVWEPNGFAFSGTLPTSRGDVTFLSSAGAMCLRLAPDARLRRQYLLSGHVYELPLLVANGWSDALNGMLASVTNWANALLNPHGLGGFELTKQYGAIVWDVDTGYAAHVLAYQHTAPLRAVEFVGRNSAVTGDLRGLVVEWAMADGSPLRRIQSSQGNVRDMLVVSDFSSSALPELRGLTVLVTASSKGPPLVVHQLRPLATNLNTSRRPSLSGRTHGESKSLAIAARSLQDEIQVELNNAVSAITGLATGSGAFQFRAWNAFHDDVSLAAAGKAAANSTFSLCRVAQPGKPPRWVTGHVGGELLVWNDERYVRTLGARARAERSSVAESVLSASALPVRTPSRSVGRQPTLVDVRDLTLNLEKWDADFNGLLTKAEFIHGLTALADEKFASAIDYEQASALFDSLDTDRSGVIDLAEFQKLTVEAARRATRARRAHRGSMSSYLSAQSGQFGARGARTGSFATIARRNEARATYNFSRQATIVSTAVGMAAKGGVGGR